MPTLEELVTKANNTLNKLDLLLDNRVAETIVTGNEDTPAPTLDDNGIWAVFQDTASGGIYAGSYKLLLEAASTFIQSITAVSHTTPVDNIAARYQTLGSSTWTNLSSLTALEGLALQAFEIRSSTAFEVNLRVSRFTVTTGTETEGDITPAAEASLPRLDISGNAYGRRIVIEFAQPITSATFEFHWTGAPDAVIAKLGAGNTVINNGDVSGRMTAVDAAGATTLTIDSGYSGVPSFTSRYAVISQVTGVNA